MSVVEEAIRAASPEESAAGAELAAIALQESDWRDLPARAGNGARGIWQITPKPHGVLADVEQEDKRRAKLRAGGQRLFAQPTPDTELLDQGERWSGRWQARIAAWYLTERIPQILATHGAPVSFPWRAWAYVTGPVEIGRLFREKGGPLEWEAFVAQWQVAAESGAWKPSKLGYVRSAVRDLAAIRTARDPQISGDEPVSPFPLIQFPIALDSDIPFDSLRARTVLRYWRPRVLDAAGNQTSQPVLFESDLDELKSYGARRWGKSDPVYVYRALFGGGAGRTPGQDLALAVDDALPAAAGVGGLVLLLALGWMLLRE